MWLNPSACMGTGRPLISSCLMRDIDRPHLTQRTARRRAPPPAPPPPLHLLRLMRLKEEKMEASNVGKHGGEKNCSGSGNWLDLDLIYECTPFLFISPRPLSLSLWVSPSLSPCLIVHKHEQHKNRNISTHRNMQTPLPATLCRRLIMISGVTF